MDRYKTNQVIEAFQITEIKEVDGIYRILGEEDEITVYKNWVKENNPMVQGWFIRSMDGVEYYLSYDEFFRRGFLIDPTARKV